jgi:hypothetical protein
MALQNKKKERKEEEQQQKKAGRRKKREKNDEIKLNPMNRETVYFDFITSIQSQPST